MKVLIIGNGIAGMSAAIEAAELDDEVILVSPVQSERTQSVMAAEGINAVVDTAEEDSVVWHANDTLESGCFLEKEEDVRNLCEKAPEHLKDEEFLRGKVPMTKSEVRSVSIAELELTEDAIVYDIGAGTGSVSIEIARAGEQIRVYAIEKNPEGVELIDQNRKKFKTDGVRIIEGLAPQALEELETPTHAFVGGSSGNLREIVQLLQKKNPDVRIVINAISLETVSEVMGLVEEGILPDAEILQVSAARSKVLGRYHMMMGQNPVYIISAGRRKPGQV